MSLATTYSDLRSAIGHFLGYGADATPWTTGEAADIARALKSGLNRFYVPMVMPGETKAHQWTFLRPKYSVNTVASDYDTDMPLDYAQILGPIDFDNSENQNHRIRIVSEAVILNHRMTDVSTGAPQYAAIRPKAQTAGSAQGFEMIFWPTPDAIYTLHFRYQINPAIMSTSNTYPYGGEAHSETIIAACLAAAEEQKDDAPATWNGRFMERLQASIAHDRTAHGPEFLGYNGDPSVMGGSDSRDSWYVTYGGVLPD